MIFKKAKRFSISMDEVSGAGLEKIAEKNKAKATSGTVKESIGFVKIFDDLDLGAKYFEFVGQKYVSKIQYETRIPASRDVERLLTAKKAQLRTEDPEIKFTRSKTIELRKECIAELRGSTAPTLTVYFLIVDLKSSEAFITAGNKKDAERLSTFLGQAGLRIQEEPFSINIEDDLTMLLENPERFPEGWELGAASSLANIEDKSRVSYSTQDLSSNELHENTEKSKKAVEVEFVFKEAFKLRINSSQSLTNIKFLQKEPPEWMEFSSEKGENGEEVDALRAVWEFEIFVVKTLFNAVKVLFDNIDSDVVPDAKYTEADLEFTEEAN